ncbi:MAG: hypothetical protein K6U74_18685 [Firmicutes bacterium]|nr:hypothetical protein [Bacillota bacterium]
MTFSPVQGIMKKGDIMSNLRFSKVNPWVVNKLVKMMAEKYPPKGKVIKFPPPGERQRRPKTGRKHSG